jgi:two-component system C4-dicarboxylate transport response regulator DctD
LPQRVERFEALLIKEALESSNGSVKAALTQLQIPRKTLYDKLRRYGIAPSDYRER